MARLMGKTKAPGWGRSWGNWPERAGDALDGDPLFAAITALRDHVRQVSGLHQQRRDRPLMEQAFKQDGTHLRLNPLADPDPSSSQQNEQRGFRELYCGVITALRNPLVHEGPSSSFAQTRYPDRKTMLKYRSFLSILFERDERDQEVPTLLLGMRRRLRSRHMRRQYR